MVNQSSQKDPFRLLDIIKETGVTVMQATPTTYEVSYQVTVHCQNFCFSNSQLKIFFLLLHFT